MKITWPSLKEFLNPDWVEWLMGLPTGWTNVKCEDPVPFQGWSEDPADTGGTPRITTIRKNRRKRLMMLGNGVVPQQAALALKLLLRYE